VRVAVLGCGAIGSWHARIMAETAQAELVAICDLDGDRVGEMADRLGTRAFTDAERLLADLRPDAVVIATPEEAHVAQAQAAARAGAAMLIEKPVASDLAGVAAIAAAAELAGVMVMAAHVERFEVGYAQLQSAVAQGVCGRVVSIAARRRFGPVQAPRFAGRSSTLRLLGVHDFDLLCWIHPVAPIEVFAAAGRGAIYEACGMDDHVATTIRYADGALGQVVSAWTLPLGYEQFATPEGWNPSGDNLLEVFGDTGMLANDLSLHHQQLAAFDAAGLRAAGLRHQPLLHGRVVGALRDEGEHFLKCVRDGTPPLVGLEDARRAIALTAAAEQSLATGAPVRPEW
jgi:predicted dehydrogenase